MKLYQVLLFGTALCGTVTFQVFAMHDEDGNDGHHLSNLRHQNPPAGVYDPQEEARQFHRLQDFVKGKLTFHTTPTLRPVVDTIMYFWNQNKPSPWIRDETQIRERATRRARALDQLKDFYEPLKAGMTPARLAEIYEQLFDKQNQSDVLRKKKRIILRHSAALFTSNMSDVHCAKIVKTALQVDATEIGLRVAAIPQNAEMLFTPDISGYERALIIGRIVKFGLEAVLDLSAINWGGVRTYSYSADAMMLKMCVSLLRNENPFREKLRTCFETLILDEHFRYRDMVITAIARYLEEDHPIAQKFIQLGLGMENQHDPNSFLAVHQEVLAKRGQPVLHKPRIMDNGVTFNTAMTQEPRPRGDAKLVLKSQWKQMVTDLEAFRAQQRNAFQELGLELPSDLQELKEPPFF